MSTAADTTARCRVCPHECLVRQGETGFCRARANRGGVVVDEGYGRVTALAVDPVEKKPLAEWRPGSKLLSVGSYGCNMRCAFCQNFEISQAEGDLIRGGWRYVGPDELVDACRRLREEDPSVVGIAYTYNEPLVGWEYVRDCSRLAREAGLANVLVSNGCVAGWVVDEVAPAIDAANIDLKCFTREGYAHLGGSLEAVRGCIERLADCPTCHLEVTTLIVPGLSDDEREMRRMSRWLSELDPGIVLHLTRFFPRWRMAREEPTPVETVRRLARVARESLPDVRIGNC